MALLKIITYGHPILRKFAKPVTQFDNDLAELAEDMIETMIEADGIGLAAPQVNKSIRMITIGLDLIDEELEPRAFVNPEIIDKSDETETLEEGCLSVPGIREEVTRPLRIKVKFNNLDGTEETWDTEGLLSTVFQHEIDHLNGVIFTDYVSSFKKQLIEPKLAELESSNN